MRPLSVLPVFLLGCLAMVGTGVALAATQHERPGTERVALAGPQLAAQPGARPRQSLARMILSQAHAAEAGPVRDTAKPRHDKIVVHGADDSEVPGALVATIFGVFGLLVVARRSLR